MTSPLTVTYALPELSDEARIQGSLLNELQITCITRQITELMNQKLLLNYVPSAKFDVDFIAYVQKQAELAGQINALQYLLSLHEAAKIEMYNLAVTQKPNFDQEQ